MKQILSFGLFCLLALTSAAQEDEMPDLVDAVVEEVSVPQAETGMFEENGMLGFRDQSGKTVIPPVYDYLYPETWATFMLASREGYYGAIDQYNKVLIPFEYDLLEPTPNWTMNRRLPAVVQTAGILLIAQKNGLYGIVNAAGEVVLPLEYEYVGQERYGNFSASKNGKWGLTNRRGEILLECAFDARVLVDLDAGQFIVKKNAKWGVMGPGREMLLPAQYDTVQNAGLFFNMIAQNGKYGLWDKKAIRERFSPRFDAMINMNRRSEYWAVRNKGYWGLADSDGKVLVPLEFDSIAMPFYGFKHGVLVKTGAQAYTVYTTSGERLFPGTYASVNSYLSSAFIVQDENGKFGMLRPDGASMLPLEFDEIKNGMSRALFARKGEFFAAFDTMGKQATPFNIKAFSPYGYIELTDGRKLLHGLSRDGLPDYTVFDGIEAFDPSFTNFIVSQKKDGQQLWALVLKLRLVTPVQYKNVSHVPLNLQSELQQKGIRPDQFRALGTLPNGKQQLIRDDGTTQDL